MTSFKDKILALRTAGIEPDLPTLIALAKFHEMTEEELEENRRSWIISELLLSFPKMRKTRAEALYNEARIKFQPEGLKT